MKRPLSILFPCLAVLLIARIGMAQTDAPSEPVKVISLSQKPLIVGQWVIIRDQRADTAGKTVVQFFKQEIAQTTTGRRVLLESVADAAGQFQPAEHMLVSEPLELEAMGLSPQLSADQTLKVGDKSYRCHLETYRFTTAGSTATRTLQLWRAEGLKVCPPALPIPNAERRIVRLPADTLQCEWTIHTDDYDAKRRITLQSPSETVGIQGLNKREIPCSRYRDTTVARRKDGNDLPIITDVWLNDAVLGRRVRWVLYDSEDASKIVATRTVTDFNTPTAGATEHDATDAGH